MPSVVCDWEKLRDFVQSEDRKDLAPGELKKQFLEEFDVPNPEENIPRWFGELFTDEDIYFKDKKLLSERRRVREEAIRIMIDLAGKYRAIKKEPDVAIKKESDVAIKKESDVANWRFIVRTLLYKPEEKDIMSNLQVNTILHNQNVDSFLADNNYAGLGQLLSECIMELPSYDFEDLEILPDGELSKLFANLYPVYLAATNAETILKGVPGIEGYITEEAKGRLRKIGQDEEIFAVFKARLDGVLDSFYPYIDIERGARELNNKASRKSKEEELVDQFVPYIDIERGAREVNNKASGNSKEEELVNQSVVRDWNSGIYYYNGLMKRADSKREVSRVRLLAVLKNLGLDGTLVYDRKGECYDVKNKNDWARLGSELSRGEPIICGSLDKWISICIDDNKVLRNKGTFVKSEVKVGIYRKADATKELINGSIASPWYLQLTGSREYERMQRAFDEYDRNVLRAYISNDNRDGIMQFGDEAKTIALTMRDCAFSYLNLNSASNL